MPIVDAPRLNTKPLVTEERYRVVLEIMKKKLLARESAESKVALLARGEPRSSFGPFALRFEEVIQARR